MWFLHVKFIADFRTMLMACSGRQFGLCRRFTYRPIIPPTPDRLEAKAVSTAQPEDTLSGVPQEYHEFHDVFSGEKANVLAPHWPYDLKINLEGVKLFHGLIYLLSPPELTVLREFLEENIQNGFIHPSNSPCVPPVFYVKKNHTSL